MAVSIEHKGSGITLQSLGDKVAMSEVAHTLADSGATLLLSPKMVTIKIGTTLLASTTVNTEALPLFMSGELSPVSADVLTDKLQVLFADAASEFPGATSKPKVKTAKSFSLKEELQASTPEIVQPTATAKITAPGYADPSSGTPVKLEAATKLHQRVRGTSGASVYHVVAFGEGIKIAARMRTKSDAWTLSIRYEGPGVDAYAGQFAKAGVTHHGGYASVHLNGEGKSSVSCEQKLLRALGAILLASDLPLTAVACSNGKIINKGVE